MELADLEAAAAEGLSELCPENERLITRAAFGARFQKDYMGNSIYASDPPDARYDAIVDPGQSLEAAIARCPAGGSLLLRSGMHWLPDDGLRIDRSVHLFGSPHTFLILLVSMRDTQAVVEITSSNVSLVRLCIVRYHVAEAAEGVREGVAISLLSGRNIVIQDCHILSEKCRSTVGVNVAVSDAPMHVAIVDCVMENFDCAIVQTGGQTYLFRCCMKRVGMSLCVNPRAETVVDHCELDSEGAMALFVSSRARSFEMQRSIVKGVVVMCMLSPILFENRIIGKVKHSNRFWMMDVSNAITPRC